LLGPPSTVEEGKLITTATRIRYGRSAPDGLRCLRIEEMPPFEVDSDLDLIAHLHLGARCERRDPLHASIRLERDLFRGPGLLREKLGVLGYDWATGECEVDDDQRPERLGQGDLPLDAPIGRCRRERAVLHVLA